MLYKNLNPLWIHGFLTVPDGRILIERLCFGVAEPAPWCASVGRLSYRLQDTRKMLESIVLRRFGLELNDNNADIERLLTHTAPKQQILNINHTWATMEVYRIRLLTSVTISTKRSCDIMALSFEDLVDDVARSRYEDASIEAINIADAMQISF